MPYINVNSNRQSLCLNGKLPLIYCNSQTIFHKKHSAGHQMHSIGDRMRNSTNGIGHRMDAVIYSMIVAIFYAGIILIILITNTHRFRKTKSRRKKSKCSNSRLTANGARISSLPIRSKSLSSVEKQLIVNTNKVLTVLDSSDKYPESLI